MSYSGRRIKLFKNRIGPSVNSGETLLGLLYDVHNRYSRTCQFHLGGNLSLDDIKASRMFMSQKLMTFHIHSPVNINLASDKEVVVRNSMKSLNNILTQIAELDATCVAHCGAIGKHQQVISGVNALTTLGYLLLENSAGAGTQLGSSISDMKLFMSNITRPNTGICIDTQHAFAAGVTKWDSYEESLKTLDTYNSLGQIKLIHLNDSKVEYNSRVDSHQIVGKGFIWSDLSKRDGLKGIIDWCRVNDVDIVEETPDSDQTISFLRDMYL